MKIDIHCHVLGNGIDINNVANDVYLYADDNQHWFTRILYNMLEDDLVRMEADLNKDGAISTDEYFNLDRDVRIKHAHGFSDSIPENAEKVLRLTK